MPVNPQEFATLLYESSIPDEVKSAIVHDLIPKMTFQDIIDLYEILKREDLDKKELTKKLEKNLVDIQTLNKS